MFLSFPILYFLGFGLNLWLLGVKSRPGHGQMVDRGAQLSVAHLWIRPYTLSRDGLAQCRQRGVIQQIGLGVGAHRWRTGRTVRCGAS